ncbi:hypothetical protein BDZ89DRAFT_1067428 [Hymenopellis radicata]|nr:hypothetical protein BDZ89DRAFT_1067428 [Hymenopellis radicata]
MAKITGSVMRLCDGIYDLHSYYHHVVVATAAAASDVFRCMLSECFSSRQHGVDAGSPDAQHNSSGRGGCDLQYGIYINC